MIEIITTGIVSITSAFLGYLIGCKNKPDINVTVPLLHIPPGSREIVITGCTFHAKPLTNEQVSNLTERLHNIVESSIQ